MSLLVTSFTFSIATNRALIIGIGKYKTDTGWKNIHGDADVELLKPKLEKHGFIVHTLVNEQATKEAIQKAFEGGVPT